MNGKVKFPSRRFTPPNRRFYIENVGKRDYMIDGETGRMWGLFSSKTGLKGKSQEKPPDDGENNNERGITLTAKTSPLMVQVPFVNGEKAKEVFKKGAVGLDRLSAEDVETGPDGDGVFKH